MFWFNYYGLAVVVIIMVPNIIYAVKKQSEFANAYKNKTVEILEQIGRYACMAFMVFNIPYACFNFWFSGALAVYLSVNGGLCLLYCLFWVLLWNKDTKLKALSLSVIPSAIFLFSGIVLAHIPLIAFAIIFCVNHVLLSYKNFAARQTLNS